MTATAGSARLRQALYRYFGRALLPPNAHQIAGISAAKGFFDAAEIDVFAYYGPWRAFAETAASADVGALSIEYVSLFASGVDGALCPPTESYYVGAADGGKIARVVAEVGRQYAHMALSPAHGSEAPDHIATELEAMSLLCAREAEARAAGFVDLTLHTLELEGTFLRRHLGAWLPAFRARIDEVPVVSSFYATLTTAVHAFVVHDIDLVAMLQRHIEGAAA